MTKYELKQNKRLARIEKRQARRLKRKLKREERKFNRLSNTKYRLHHRLLIKSFRIGGPILGFGYAAYSLYNSLFLKLHELPTQVDKLNLRNASMLLVAGSVVLGFAVYFGFKYIKRATIANAVARNEGKPSYSYSPVVVTFIKMILSSWLFGLMYLFSYIGTHYGEALEKGFEKGLIAFIVGFGLLLVGDILEQSILKSIANRKHKAEDITRQMIYDMKQE